MMSCKKVTHLLSEGQDRSLTLGERMNLKMHLAMCAGCRNFDRQMVFLRQACRRFGSKIFKEAPLQDKNH